MMPLHKTTHSSWGLFSTMCKHTHTHTHLRSHGHAQGAQFKNVSIEANVFPFLPVVLRLKIPFQMIFEGVCNGCCMSSTALLARFEKQVLFRSSAYVAHSRCRLVMLVDAEKRNKNNQCFFRMVDFNRHTKGLAVIRPVNDSHTMCITMRYWYVSLHLSSCLSCGRCLVETIVEKCTTVLHGIAVPFTKVV